MDFWCFESPVKINEIWLKQPENLLYVLTESCTLHTSTHDAFPYHLLHCTDNVAVRSVHICWRLTSIEIYRKESVIRKNKHTKHTDDGLHLPPLFPHPHPSHWLLTCISSPLLSLLLFPTSLWDLIARGRMKKKKKENGWDWSQTQQAEEGGKKKLDRQGDGDKCWRRHRLGGRRTNWNGNKH